jgi:hypothetical protein
MSDLRELVQNFMIYDEKVSDLRKRISKLNKKRTQFKFQIVKYMMKHDIRNIKVGNENLRLKKKKRFSGFNKKYLQYELEGCKMLKDPNKAKILVEMLYKNKPRDSYYDLVRM